MVINKNIIAILVLVLLYIFVKKILLYNSNQTKIMNVNKQNANNVPKMIAFDLDETLGYFTELSIFWDALENYYNKKLSNEQFFQVLNIFPEVFRPDIFKILNMINNKRKKSLCNKICIYTNNQGPKSWVKMISEYFNKKLGYKVFDDIIAAYKVRGEIIEPKRTSNEKNLKDLLNCTKMPLNTEICFIDDLYHHLMYKKNVYYIHIKPYRHSLPFIEMATRYYDKIIKPHEKIKKDLFINNIVSFMKQYEYYVVKKNSEKEKEDILNSKELYSNLDDYTKNNKISNTKKRRKRINKTLKNN